MNAEDLLIYEKYKDIEYTTLYHIGYSPPMPYPLDRYRDFNHSAVSKLKSNKGVFLTDRPDVLYSAIKDELLKNSLSKQSRLKSSGTINDKTFKWTNRPGHDSLLKIWAVRIPKSVVKRLGGVKPNPNVKKCREIVIPEEFWHLAKVERSTKSLEDLYMRPGRESSYTAIDTSEDFPIDYKSMPEKLLDKSDSDLRMIISSIAPEDKQKIVLGINSMISQLTGDINHYVSRRYGNETAQRFRERLTKYKRLLRFFT